MIKDILSGIKSYGKAIGLINQLKLWKFFLIPALIGLLTGSAILLFAYTMSDNVGDRIANIWAWEWGKETVTTISHFIGGLLVVLIGITVYKHIVMALSAPFMSPVSEKIEVHLTGVEINYSDTWTEFVALLFRGIKINIRNLFYELLYTLPLMVLSFIPVLNVVTAVLIFYTQSYYAGFGNMDYTMERYFGYNDSIQFVKRHKGTAVGNGLLFSILLFIPLVGIMLTLPVSTVASTIETLKKLEQEKRLKLLAIN
jgi:CysZ protein